MEIIRDKRCGTDCRRERDNDHVFQMLMYPAQIMVGIIMISDRKSNKKNSDERKLE